MPCCQTYPVHHSSCAVGGTRNEQDGGTITFVDEVLSMAEMILKRPVAYKNERRGTFRLNSALVHKRIDKRRRDRVSLVYA
jgi:hypothetical protein